MIIILEYKFHHRLIHCFFFFFSIFLSSHACFYVLFPFGAMTPLGELYDA